MVLPEEKPSEVLPEEKPSEVLPEAANRAETI
jgi:hypothetical protein